MVTQKWVRTQSLLVDLLKAFDRIECSRKMDIILRKDLYSFWFTIKYKYHGIIEVVKLDLASKGCFDLKIILI